MRLPSIVAIGALCGLGMQSAAGMHEIPLSKFPELPADIRTALENRGCKIPEPSSKAHLNVIRGEFILAGQTDWAVLCATKKGAELLVFPGSDEGAVVVSALPAGFSSWVIRVMDRSFLIPPVWRGPKTPVIEHEGIGSHIEWGYPDEGPFRFGAEDTVLYHHEGQWLHLGTVDVN